MYKNTNLEDLMYNTACKAIEKKNLDSRIGILIRNGKTIYYAYLGGFGTDNYWERRTLEDIEDVLEYYDRKGGTK